MSIICATSIGCTDPAVGVCEACGKPFCEAHASPKHKHLCHNDAGWTEPGPVRMMRDTAYWNARRTAREKNEQDLCGVEWCQHKAAVKCVSCHGSYCETHLTEVTYLRGRHADIHGSKGLPEARKGPICESCLHNHIDVTLVKLA